MPQLLRLASLAACLGMALLPAHAPAADADTELEARIAAMGRIGSAGGGQYSPDGSRIAYVSDVSGTPQIYIVSRTGGAPERLTMRGAQNVAPDWGANGLIAYQTLSGGKFMIAIIDPATKQERIITPYDASFEDPSWAPDGRHIAAARAVNYNYSIYLLDTMGDKPVALTTSGDWTAPAWSR